MAKDPAISGPISKPTGGFYESSEEIRKKEAGIDEILTRSEVINILGEQLGQLLIDAGYSTIASIILTTDKELEKIRGVGKASIAKIRELIPAPPAPEEPKAPTQQPPTPSVSTKKSPHPPIGPGDVIVEAPKEVSVRVQRIRDSQQ